MCWVNQTLPVAKVAKEDFHVYKVVKPELKSFYKDFQYKLNKLYKLNDDLKIYNGFEGYFINEGFHSYDYSLTRISNVGYTLVVIFIPIGYRCVLDYISLFDSPLVVECIIPKGSTYYINDVGEIVSNSIKIIKIK